MSNIDHHIELIQQLFKCRKDVFAIRWEKGSKKVICLHIATIRMLTNNIK